MNTTLETNSINSTEWTIPDGGNESGVFSADHVVEAYFKGKRAGKDEANEIVQNELKNRIETVGKQTMSLITYLTKFKVTPSNVFLRVNSLKSFDVLVIIKEKDFLSDKMIEIYNHIGSMQSEVSCAYNFNFVVKEGLNMDAVKSDDYILRHMFNAKPQKTRRA